MLLQLKLCYSNIYENFYNIIFKTKEKLYIASGFGPTYPYRKKNMCTLLTLYKVIWGIGGIAPFIRNVGVKYELVVTTRSPYTLGNRLRHPVDRRLHASECPNRAVSKQEFAFILRVVVSEMLLLLILWVG